MNWTFGEAKIWAIRARVASWQVHETVARRAAICRQCGEIILKGERRLTFRMLSVKYQREAHIHLMPCNQLLKDPDYSVNLPCWLARA